MQRDKAAIVYAAMAATFGGLGNCDNCGMQTKWYGFGDITFICKDCGRAFKGGYFWLNEQTEQQTS